MNKITAIVKKLRLFRGAHLLRRRICGRRVKSLRTRHEASMILVISEVLAPSILKGEAMRKLGDFYGYLVAAEIRLVVSTAVVVACISVSIN
jgi:hypothetical protein